MSDIEKVAIVAMLLVVCFGFGGIFMRRGDRWRQRNGGGE